VASPFRQPRAVWAVAFACVVSFMGIGLVDPILPALSHQLHATPSQVSLLFTSYLVVTAVAMIFVGAVSSRIGPKRTLVAGLALVVVFSALAGSSGTIAGIVGFRAGWGLGNALFIATSLAVIVASASGGFAGAIILYETALGLGIAIGPLLGGELGSISWRGPFFGVAVLMSISLLATALFVPALPKPARRTGLLEPLRALRHRGLLVMALTALFYNWGFFTMLGYAPYPMKLNAHQLGLVFFAWGLLVAIFSVLVAPRLQGRFGTAPVLYVNLFALAVAMTVIAAGVDDPATVMATVIVTGAFIGINNTLTTQAVMLVSPVERPIASSAYGFVRFIGGGLAPFVAGKLADSFSLSVPFYVGGIAFIVAIFVLATGHRLLAAAEAGLVEDTVRAPEPPAAPSREPRLQGIRTPTSSPSAGQRGRPVIVAVGATPDATHVVRAASAIARRNRTRLEIVRVHETTVIEELAIDVEDHAAAVAALCRHLETAEAEEVPVAGLLLHSVGDHGAAARVLARHAADVDARVIAIGPSPRGRGAQFADGSFTVTLARETPCTFVLLHPESELDEVDVVQKSA
jgi:MFS transporter, ACDE family, multidrug resistance protein